MRRSILGTVTSGPKTSTVYNKIYSLFRGTLEYSRNLSQKEGSDFKGKGG